MQIDVKTIAKIAEEFLEQCLTYDPGTVEIDEVTEVGQGQYRIGVNLSEAPRMASEFLQNADSQYNVEIESCYSESDNYPSDSVIRQGLVITGDADEEEFEVERKILSRIEYKTIAIMIAGWLSAPDYSDDESDAYFNGDLFIEIDGNDWAEISSRQKCLQDIENAVGRLIHGASCRLKSIRQLGRQGPICQTEVSDLLRAALIE